MSRSDTFHVVFKDSARSITLSLTACPSMAAAERYVRKMIKKKIYLEQDLDILTQELHFGEGDYGQ